MINAKQLSPLKIRRKRLAIPKTAAERPVLEQVKTGLYARISTSNDVEKPET